MSNTIVPVDPGAIGRLNKKPGKSESADVAATGSYASPGSAGTETTAGEKVELTGRGKLVAQAEQMLAALPSIDEARVAQVRTAIENGEYVINADNIADALLRTDLEVGK